MATTAATSASGPFAYSQKSNMSTIQSSPFDASAKQPFGSDNQMRRSVSPNTPAILMRKLPLQTSKGALESMLLFAKDLLSAEFVEPRDNGYLTAVARFSSASAAREAQVMLNGKLNTTREANMIVEVLPHSPAGSTSSGRRNTEHRVTMSPDSAGLSTGPQLARQTSRFNGTFQDAISPGSAGPTHPHGSDMSKSDGYFNNAKSSVGQPPLERQRTSGKEIIGEDGMDDDTGKLLDDPVGYARNDLSGGMNSSMPPPQTRRSTLPQLPTARFGSLSLTSSGMTSPAIPGMAPPSRTGSIASPTAFSAPNLSSMGPNASYQFGGQHFMRPNFPPINPSDQNPPCNTLYVGNLPMDASEDELKALFSKQRGYKRLCLRTKQNGPMCFVEFEDITAASKALTECYGMPLHNSTKGGIRLSFSKNPLGVRTGQPGGLGMPSALSPQGPMSGMNGASGMQQPFSSVNGPPPGLAAPPGLLNINTSATNANNGIAASMNALASPTSASLNGGFAGPLSPIGTSSMGMGGMMSPTSLGGSGGSNGWPSRERGQQVPAYMMGR